MAREGYTDTIDRIIQGKTDTSIFPKGAVDGEDVLNISKKDFSGFDVLVSNEKEQNLEDTSPW